MSKSDFTPKSSSDEVKKKMVKIGLKPAHEPPVQCFQHKKVPIYLILTTFGGEITFGHITRWLGADFEETHFFWDALYMSYHRVVQSEGST